MRFELKLLLRLERGWIKEYIDEGFVDFLKRGIYEIRLGYFIILVDCSVIYGVGILGGERIWEKLNIVLNILRLNVNEIIKWRYIIDG